MKKMFTAILLMATFSFAVVSCGEKKDEAKSEGDKSEGAKTEAKAEFNVENCATPLEAVEGIVKMAEKCTSIEELEKLLETYNEDLEKKFPDFKPYELEDDDAEKFDKLNGRLMRVAEELYKAEKSDASDEETSSSDYDYDEDAAAALEYAEAEMAEEAAEE